MQFYWRLSGLGDGVEGHYLGQQRGDLDWIRIALRTWDDLEGSPGDGVVFSPPPGPSNPMRLVLKNWIKGQLRYFIKTARREGRVLQYHEWLVVTFFWLSLTLAVIAIVFLRRLAEPWQGLLLVAAGMAPVTAALLLGYIEKRALAEHLKRYDRMVELFRRARRRLVALLRAGDRTAAQQLILTLGREALAENGDWVILHRERPLEVPKGG